MLTPGDIENMAQCSQCNINTSAIARLTTTRNIFGTDTPWSRHQINYLVSRDDPLSTLNNNSSSVEKLVIECEKAKNFNFIYFTYHPSDSLIIFNGAQLSDSYAHININHPIT